MHMWATRGVAAIAMRDAVQSFVASTSKPAVGNDADGNASY